MCTKQNMQRKVILVSGGSRGLGLFFVQHLLEKGHIVATFARNATKATEQLSLEYEDRFRFTNTDARDYETIERFVKGIFKDFGSIDGLVNNAAIGQDHLLVHAPTDLIRDVLTINIEAPLFLTRIVLKCMLLQEQGGRIVNVSSICGSRGYPGLTVYSAAKGAIDAFTRSLAREVGERGIMVNSIAPGFFESEMSSVLLPQQLETIKRRTPTHQLTVEHQITPLLDILLFEDTNITGQTVFVDGGITI